ncbi:hypothetical protein N2152v2_005541 [Parachlorella kessleri]
MKTAVILLVAVGLSQAALAHPFRELLGDVFNAAVTDTLGLGLADSVGGATAIGGVGASTFGRADTAAAGPFGFASGFTEGVTNIGNPGSASSVVTALGAFGGSANGIVIANPGSTSTNAGSNGNTGFGTSTANGFGSSGTTGVPSAVPFTPGVSQAGTILTSSIPGAISNVVAQAATNGAVGAGNGQAVITAAPGGTITGAITQTTAGSTQNSGFGTGLTAVNTKTPSGAGCVSNQLGGAIATPLGAKEGGGSISGCIGK